MDFATDTKYYAFHYPSGESWVLLGVNPDKNRVCVAGWPPTEASLHECDHFEEAGPLTDEELKYREEQFGTNWI